MDQVLIFSHDLYWLQSKTAMIFLYTWQSQTVKNTVLRFCSLRIFFLDGLTFVTSFIACRKIWSDRCHRNMSWIACIHCVPKKNSRETTEFRLYNSTEFQLSKCDETMCLLFYYIHELIHNNVSGFSYCHQYLNKK